MGSPGLKKVQVQGAASRVYIANTHDQRPRWSYKHNWVKTNGFLSLNFWNTIVGRITPKERFSVCERRGLITERPLVASQIVVQHAERENWMLIMSFTWVSKRCYYSEAVLFYVYKEWVWLSGGNEMRHFQQVYKSRCGPFSPSPIIKGLLSILQSNHAWTSPAEFSDAFSAWALFQIHWGRIQDHCLFTSYRPLPLKTVTCRQMCGLLH